MEVPRRHGDHPRQHAFALLARLGDELEESVHCTTNVLSMVDRRCPEVRCVQQYRTTRDAPALTLGEAFEQPYKKRMERREAGASFASRGEQT